ncbi:MAG: glycosyltransferase [Acidobacteria bacterium]|nr:glycosyltransferase [Acidobacteriota bacterium]
MSSSNIPSISVIVPVRNEKNSLKACLAALNDQTLDRHEYEVIVVDDGSYDGSAAIAEESGARVVRQSPLGAAAARNRGVREARGEIVLFTDADCIVGRNWIRALSAPLVADGVYGTVGRCVSAQSHWIAGLIQLELEERYGTMAQHDQVDFLNSGNCGFRRTLLQKNPYDETFRWLEDVELSFRLASQGNRMIFVPEARVQHPHPETLMAYMRRKFHYASFAPSIYRRYPGKALSDSRTPVNRRLQLLLLLLALLSGGASVFWSGFALLGMGCLVASMVFSLPLSIAGFRKSMVMGMAAPFFVTAGNLAFIAGSARGLTKSLVNGAARARSLRGRTEPRP